MEPIYGLLYSPGSDDAHLSLSNMEILVAVVDDGILRAAGSDVGNTLRKKNIQYINTNNTST